MKSDVDNNDGEFVIIYDSIATKPGSKLYCYNLLLCYDFVNKDFYNRDTANNSNYMMEFSFPDVNNTNIQT